MRLPENWAQPAGAAEVAAQILRRKSAKTVSYYETQSDLLDDQKGTVVFCDAPHGNYRLLLFRGRFMDFPGIAEADMPLIDTEYCETRPIPEEARRGYSLDRLRSGGYVLWWVIQPDGRYYEDDDGFGAEFQEEIRLFAVLDGNGQFTGPFRLGVIGTHRFAAPNSLL